MPWGVLRLVYRIERLHLYRLIRTHRKQKRRSPKPGEAGIVERRPCQHFLDLPPEIRNCIYTFAACPTAEERCCAVPSLALAQTCRQIRFEYRSMCLKADVTIDWRHVPLYFETFFPTIDRDISNIDLAPERMTIFVNTYPRKDSGKTPVEIDIVPIIRLGLANKNFTCKLTKCEVESGPWTRDEQHSASGMQTVMAADISTVQQLFRHRHHEWVRDIQEGSIHKLMVSYIGTETYPRALFYFKPSEHGIVPSEIARMTRKRSRVHASVARWDDEAFNDYQSVAASLALQTYIRRIHLHDIFSENQYVFLWDLGLERTEPAPGVSYFLE